MERTQISPRRGYLQPGTQLSGIYQIDAPVAAGGMGEVYRGHSIQTGDAVAIKVIKADFAENESALELFRKEARALHNLQHEAIVRYFVFAVDKDLQRPYLAMEFVEGQSLSDMLRAGPMAFDQAMALRARIALGLHAAHERGIIHRDVSPDNIIMPHNDVRAAKIIDFGIARSTALGAGTIIGGSVAGKYSYMSPEQANGLEIGAKSDIYSFGLVLAEALRGKPIDMGGSLGDVIRKRMSVPDLSDVDPRARPLLEAMLAPDPERRPESMRAVAEWTPAGAKPPAQTSSSKPASGAAKSGPADVGAKKSAAPMAIAALALLIALGGGLWVAAPMLGLRGGDPTPTPQAVAPPTPAPAPQPAAPAAPQPAAPQPVATQPAAPSSPQAPPPTPAPSLTPPAPSLTPPAPSLTPPAPSLTPPAPTLTSPAPAPPAPVATPVAPPAPDPPPAPPAQTATNDPAPAAPRVEPPATPVPAPPPGPQASLAPGADQPLFKPPATDLAPLAQPERIEQMGRFLRDFRGGDCFVARPLALAADSVEVEGVATDAAPLEQLNDAFKAQFGFEPNIGAWIISQAQCAVTSFLSKARIDPAMAPRLELAATNLRSGQYLSGMVEAPRERVIEVLQISDDGEAQNITALLRNAGARSFNLRVERAKAGGGPKPQLIVAIASAQPLQALRSQRGVPADRMFPAALAEAQQRGQPIGVSVRAYNLD